MPDEAVLCEQAGAVVTLTLHRPDRRNALDDEVRAGLARALAHILHDPSVRVVVITGAGESFSTGADLRGMMDLKARHQSVAFRGYLEAGHALVKAIRELPKPVVAAVNGPAIDAGMNLALACDLRIASDRATFRQAFLEVGLHPDWGGTFSLPRLVGLGRALQMYLLGEPLGPEEAFRIGLVNRVVPHERLTAETETLAARLASAPPLPVALLKQALYQRLETQLDLMMDFEVAAQMKCFESKDCTEGLEAFLAGRPARFKGF
jgi:2-(1,2-epoxy-1,2-dihydrophenyl)acetyl-CoA isomerase